ncbi:MAG: spore germination protein [Eubacteriales bacterium]|nr:spore germination protein [Eubacteriales bacterium]
MLESREVEPDLDNIKGNLFTGIQEGSMPTADLFEETDFEKAIDEVLVGNTVIFVDGFEKCIILSTKGFPKRGVSNADTEVVVQGSKEAFTETFRVNSVLIRRRIRDTNLKLKQMRIGRRSQTDIGIMYMQDLVRPEILDEVLKRLKKIDIDAILDSGYIEQFIEDDYLSPFPQMQMTERPDKVASALLEGRVAILVDNTPFVIIVPTVLASFYQSAEDYYQRWGIMSFIRIIRYIAGVIAVCLPGLYIATAIYHPSMIPMELIIKMSDARKTVPIPAVLEVILMEIAFETLREAGIRLPQAIGSTLGIVGGIIIGQAAVEAGLVSPIVVIVISLTAICSFAIPNIALVSGYRITKYFIILMASLLGIFGFWIGLLVCLIHLVTLKSFGIPYLYPFVSSGVFGLKDIKDTFLKLPIFMLKKRPIFTRKGQRTRMNFSKDKERGL